MPASPPPPPPCTPPPPLPSLHELPMASTDAPLRSSYREDITGPAHLLYRMSIAALVDERANTPSSDSDPEPRARPQKPPQRTPISSKTQKPTPAAMQQRRRSAGPHFSMIDDDFDSDSDPVPVPPPTSHGSAKKRKTSSKTRNKSTKSSTISSPVAPSQGTLIVYQPSCLDHHNDAHQENRARLTALCGPNGILHQSRFRSLQWADLRSLQPVRLCDMLRVHSFEYVRHLEKTCAALPAQESKTTVGTLYSSVHTGARDTEPLYPQVWEQTPHAQRCYAVEHPSSGGFFDGDSPISSSSYTAARLAAGAVCHAIDRVLKRETKNAFVAVRPPGHHAGPNGCVESDGFHRRPEMCTCGFCLLNNVAIGAAYAMATYSSGYSQLGSDSPVQIDRVAIIDFDIHHGNGTEEILRNLVPHQQPYPLPSSWAPLSFVSYKPWRDEHDVDNVFFASIHLHDGDAFYPGSGSGPNGDSPELQHQRNILNLPLEFIGPKYLEDRERLTVKAKAALMERASRLFRDRVTTQLLPALRSFQPDLMLLSAGFDGHADDFYYYLTESDYEWMTEQLLAVAEECCDGRVVSVLEGGYNVEVSPQQKRRLHAKSKKRSASTSSSPARTEGEEDDHDDSTEDEKLVYGSLARSCAAHVAVLQRFA